MSGIAAARELGVSLATLSRMVKRGDLRPVDYNPVRKRQRLDFDRATLAAYRAERERQAEAQMRRQKGTAD